MRERFRFLTRFDDDADDYISDFAGAETLRSERIEIERRLYADGTSIVTRESRRRFRFDDRPASRRLVIACRFRLESKQASATPVLWTLSNYFDRHAIDARISAEGVELHKAGRDPEFLPLPDAARAGAPVVLVVAPSSTGTTALLQAGDEPPVPFLLDGLRHATLGTRTLEIAETFTAPGLVLESESLLLFDANEAGPATLLEARAVLDRTYSEFCATPAVAD